MLKNNSSSSKTVQQQLNQPKQQRQTLTNNNIINNDSIDIFLADSFTSHLKENLGTSKFDRIEKTLCGMFEKTVKECIASSDTGKVAIVLRVKLKSAAKSKNIIKKIVEQLFSVSYRKKTVITLHDESLCDKAVFFYCGSKQKKTIMDFLCDKSVELRSPQVHMSPATFYRHAKELVDEGLLVISPDDKNTRKNNKNTYTCIFSDIGFVQSNNNDSLKVQLTIKDEFLKSSLLYRQHHSAKIYRKELKHQNNNDNHKTSGVITSKK